MRYPWSMVCYLYDIAFSPHKHCLVVVGAILRLFIIYITEHLQHLNYFVEYVSRVERSLSRTRVVLIYPTNPCLSNVVPMLLLDEDDGVVYLYHCHL